MNTPSLEAMSEVMTGIKHCCDVAHRCSEAIKNPARGGVQWCAIGSVNYQINDFYGSPVRLYHS